jgi:hypothetical protein
MPPPTPAGPSVPPASVGPSPQRSGWPSDVRFPATLFTAQPNPLMLNPVLATRRASSRVIGPKGGTIKARGTDGTRYTLEVPAEALPLGMTVTMTPLDALGGFPEGAQPEHVLGVQLEPDGLLLSRQATLSIEPKQALPAELAAIDYEGNGAQAGFQSFEADGRRITLAVEHFSGHTVTFPTLTEMIERIAAFRRWDPARALDSEIAAILALERQRQLLNGSVIDLDSIARAFLPVFVELVLAPRVVAASQGCAQAEAAIAAILAYERNRQLLGVADDPDFALPTGANSLMNLPARLVDLRVRLCFREAHAQCVRTGDFPAMATYFLAAFRQSEVILEVPPTTEQVDLAHGYLRRCGRYCATMKLDVPRVESSEHFQAKERFTLEVELEWKPGDGAWGIVGSTIDGEGEHSDIEFAFRATGCVEGDRISNAMTRRPGQAKIESLTYDLVFGPTTTGEPLPPQPRALVLVMAPGSIVFDDVNCAGGHERFIQDYAEYLAIFQLLDSGATRDLGGGALRMENPWTFSVGPFKAEWKFRKVYPRNQGGIGLDIAVSLVHEPS